MARGIRVESDIADRVAALVAERVEGGAAGQAAEFARRYAADMPQGDIRHADAEALYGAAMALWGLLRHRRPGAAKVRVYNPRFEEHGWKSDHTVIEAVTDDMPFLVDSLTGALTRDDLSIHLVVHPVVPVVRDAQGRFERIAAAPGEGLAEAVMHFEIDRLADDTGLARLARTIEAVLADVRAAVADWPMMRARAAELADALEAGAAGEAATFLRWLHDNHFTFLGAREVSLNDAGEVVVAPGSGLGLLRDPAAVVFASMHRPHVARLMLEAPEPLIVAKADRHATVHRPVFMDVVAVKRFDAAGRAVGLSGFVGLFTADVYINSPSFVPLVRTKVERVIALAGFRPDSHDAKRLANILDNLPRDELFQASDDELLTTALGILALQERRRVALFARRDRFGRFVSCLVFVPRDRYDTLLRQAAHRILEQAFGGRTIAYATQLADSPLAQLHVIVATGPEGPAAVDPVLVESRIAEAARSWGDRLRHALVEARGEDGGLPLLKRYRDAFPAAYREHFPATAAVFDIDRIEEVISGASGFGMHLYRPLEAGDEEVRLKIYRPGGAIALSDILPMLESLGFRALEEVPFQVRPAEGGICWIHDFALLAAEGGAVDLSRLRAPLAEALPRVWSGAAETDGMNRLVLRAGLSWREVAVLRAYARYLRQTGYTFSQAYIEESLTAHPDAALLLVALFAARFDPALGAGRDGRIAAIQRDIAAALDAVASADQDRILRRYANLIMATVRTNHYRTGPDDTPRPHLALKFDSRLIEDLPLPRPLFEAFIYAPRVEGVHLRGGTVARGGIRWSDRREDFRTEVLGLMKAQMVKNTVIVPMGAKGGFVLKQPPRGDRDALAAEGVACYRMFVDGLLDITDTLAGGEVVPPPGVVRHDGDDPYLVVAADKGTATFSDIANALALAKGFWLGDAFASGGSHGYDHKAMAITARGAWEAVKRHFRELGRDIQAEPFTVAGVGDMSGDVFGNGMLLSPHIRLVAAFNHQHIFIDPAPGPARSFAERQRLFGLPRSTWADYDRALISPGGGVFERAAKSLRLPRPARDLLGLAGDTATPAEVIRAILCAEVDLLYFGGIGTVVKASSETQAEAGDKANDAIRVDANRLRAKVVAEGANLAVTQRGRVEAALAGVRLNTDAIDNSAGVDCSDHEVNIKILLDGAIAAGDVTERQRNDLLVAMTDEVAALVLVDNYLQTQAISLAEAEGVAGLPRQERLMRLLERLGKLNRALEFLPGPKALADRQAARSGLTRPELAVLMAYAKIWLYEAILASGLPDEPLLAEDLSRYFPTPLREPFAGHIRAHRLRREIIATSATNSMVNRLGGAFVAEMVETTGLPPDDVARAYLASREAFGLRELWAAIDALDGRVPAAVQMRLRQECNRLLERASQWVLRHGERPLDIGAVVAELSPGIGALAERLDAVATPRMLEGFAARTAEYVAAGVPEDLAGRVARAVVLAAATDIVRIAAACRLAVAQAARIYFALGGRFALGWLRAAAERLPVATHWQALAVNAVIDEFHAHQRDLALRVLETPGRSIDDWLAGNRPLVARADQLLTELQAAPSVDLPMLMVASRQFRQLIGG